jgi:putative endonuclease
MTVEAPSKILEKALKQHQYFVYILECADKSYYTGITNNIDLRLAQHEAGIDQTCYTFSRRPFLLRYVEIFSEVMQAIAREKQLKGWSRKKKEALFEEDWAKLMELSKSKEKYFRVLSRTVRLSLSKPVDGSP